MSAINLFQLAARHAEWTATRQTLVAANIANADTPGYAAVDIQPFGEVMAETRFRMAHTGAGHIAPPGDGSPTSRINRNVAEVTSSGNSVQLDQELIKADDINKAYSLDTSIVRSFHRMLLASVRSGQ